MRLILVRHGETYWNLEKRMQGRTDTELTERGIAQARALAEELKDEKIDFIYSSPLKRASFTAKEIAKYHPNAKIIIAPELIERSYGILEGMTREEALRKYPQYFHKHIPLTLDINNPPEKGESFEDVLARVLPFLRELERKHPNSTVLLVGHGGINKVLLCGLLGYKKDKYMEMGQENVCINELELKKGKARVIRMNDTTHLNSLGSEPAKEGFR